VLKIRWYYYCYYFFKAVKIAAAQKSCNNPQIPADLRLLGTLLPTSALLLPPTVATLSPRVSSANAFIIVEKEQK